jgi:hypothetical protein
MQRHSKELQEKAKKCAVTADAEDHTKMWVDSPSGKTYLLTEAANGGWYCTCRWSEYHDTSVRPCAHALACEMWIDEHLDDRKDSFWASEEAAKRQHQKTERVGLGLWKTSRKGYTA